MATQPVQPTSSTKVGSAKSASTKLLFWSGIALSTLAILFLAFDSVIKIIQHIEAVRPTLALGYAANLVVPIGIIELVCLALYAYPRTAVLGAILLTGHLGGAVATHLRAGSSLFQMLFPFLIGGLIWGGLYLRDHQLRALIPLRNNG